MVIKVLESMVACVYSYLLTYLFHLKKKNSQFYSKLIKKMK